MVESERAPLRLGELWRSVRNPDLDPSWGLTIAVLTMLGVSVAIAAGLGSPERTLYVLFPLLLSAVLGLAAGIRVGAVAGAVTALLVTLAAVTSVSPLMAAISFSAVLLWLTIPSRIAPSASVSPLFQLVYFVIAAFGTPGVSPLDALLFALAGAVGGLVIAAVLAALKRRSEAPRDKAAPAESEATGGQEAETAGVASAAPPPQVLSWAQVLGYVVSATVCGGLLYWRLVADSQTAAWVLLTFMLVYQPTRPATLLRSLGRVLGTIIGFAIAMALSILPGPVAGIIGMAAIAPSIAYAKRDYIISVAATTVVVVTVYAAPTGEYLAWGFARTIDTAIGAAIAIALSAAVRRLEGSAGAHSSGTASPTG